MNLKQIASKVNTSILKKTDDLYLFISKNRKKLKRIYTRSKTSRKIIESIKEKQKDKSKLTTPEKVATFNVANSGLSVEWLWSGPKDGKVDGVTKNNRLHRRLLYRILSTAGYNNTSIFLYLSNSSNETDSNNNSNALTDNVDFNRNYNYTVDENMTSLSFNDYNQTRNQTANKSFKSLYKNSTNSIDKSKTKQLVLNNKNTTSTNHTSAKNQQEDNKSH